MTNTAGADPMERMAPRAQFEGTVVTGAKYALVDDVTNQGGTLAEQNNYIKNLGGCVVGVIISVVALNLFPSY